MKFTAMQTKYNSVLEQLRTNMALYYSSVKSWQKTGEKFGVNKAMARLIVNGYNPGKKVRKQLGLHCKPRAHIWKREYEREHEKYLVLLEMYENREME
jgi:hypothetical protein